MQKQGPSARTRVDACGVILYEALSGVRPFVADNLPGLVLEVARGKPLPLTRHRPALPRELERIVMRALATRPAERFASMAELVAALSSYAAADRPIARLRSSSAGLLLPRRPRRLGALVSATVLAGSVGTWLLASRAAGPEPARLQTTTRPVASEAPYSAPPMRGQSPALSPPARPLSTLPDAAMDAGRAASLPPTTPLVPRRKARPVPPARTTAASRAPRAASPLELSPVAPRSRSGRISVDDL